ncbi:MAG TPA: histidine phosphatase family protein [Myxococcales bacterium]|nr:histidine phosphatase family protein [Myxococcales bacterium]HIN85219.1 histidine phosphatase family protein [Myxococcales bacterium]
MTSNIRLFLVRHGTTNANEDGLFLGQTDSPLNENGRAEAQALAQRLAGADIDLMIASDLARARETAEIIALAHPNLELSLDKRLREIHLGEFDGLPADQVHAEHPETIQAWINNPSSARMPGAGAETLGEVQARMWKLVEEITKDGSAQNIMLVSHTFAILSLVCKVLDINLDRFRNLFIDRGSISEIRWGRFGPALACFNDTAHLKNLQTP